MRLWTIQPENVLEIIETKGVFRAELDKSLLSGIIAGAPENDTSICAPYRWMAEQMTKRIGPAPDGVEIPIWAWYRRGDKVRPDLRTVVWEYAVDSVGVRIEFEIDCRKVLLSDFDHWHYVLNRWYFPASDQDYEKFDQKVDNMGMDQFRKMDENHPLMKEIKDSWDRLFLPEFLEGGKQSSGWIQATFWELRKEWIVKVDRFRGRQRKE